MAADRRFECAQCILLHAVCNRRDQERAVNLLRWLRAIEAVPTVLQLVVALRFQILQFLCEFFGFDVRYHAPHSQLLTLHIYTHIDRFTAGSQSLGASICVCLMRFLGPIRLLIAGSSRPSFRANSRLLPFCANDMGMEGESLASRTQQSEHPSELLRLRRFTENGTRETGERKRA